jgi:hypothetical protein
MLIDVFYLKEDKEIWAISDENISRRLSDGVIRCSEHLFVRRI